MNMNITEINEFEMELQSEESAYHAKVQSLAHEYNTSISEIEIMLMTGEIEFENSYDF